MNEESQRLYLAMRGFEKKRQKIYTTTSEEMQRANKSIPMPRNPKN